MLNVRPISDLRNKFTSISKLTHKHDEPVFITKNGQSDMVVMSDDYFRKLMTRLDLYEKLSVAEAEDVPGMPSYSLEDVIRDAKKKSWKLKNYIKHTK